MKIRRHVRHFGSICGGLLLLGSVWAGSTHAATYYVATSGHDANPGTEASPLRTLNKGVTKLHPGDTLYVKSGTYTEALNNKIPGGTSWSNPVTVAAYPGHTVTLKPSGTGSILYFAGADRRYIIVDRLILDGTNVNDNAHGILIGHAGTDLAQAAHHIRIKNTEIKNIPHSGVDIREGSNFNELLNLRVHNTGLSGIGHGFYIHSHYNVVEQSYIYENKKCGIQFYHEYGPVNYNIFRYNQVYNNGLLNQGCKTALWVGPGSGTLVYNNLIWDNADRGLVVDNGVSNAKVYNNTIYGNGSTGLYIYSGAKVLIKNNIVYGNGTSNITKSGSGAVLANNLTTNPLFVAPASHNFKLQAASPAINKGVTLSEVKNDYLKVARPQGGAYDIGAYEYTGSTSSALIAAPMTLRIIDAQ
jgi:parallel beta-helix repeat protein